MPRRAEVSVRPLDPDPVYQSQLVTQLINKVMNDGKKSVAEKIVYDALDRVGSKTGKPAVEVLEQAVKTVTPVLEVRPRRVGGAVALPTGRRSVANGSESRKRTARRAPSVPGPAQRV